jgi:hypothetical protein
MRMRRSSALFLLSSILIASPAFAQQPVSDADRGAARALYMQGMDLQKNGQYADALDRFSRANSVVNAPTNMLHIAECHAALGHLVEAAETYRNLQRFPMPPNPPPAFVQAVDQGREELKTIEPRIPELKIDVLPNQVPTLTVTIDGQPVNGATIGVSRPINPGMHQVTASAPGYTKAEQGVDIKEKQSKSITLQLQSTGGVIYGPAGPPGGQPSYVTISPGNQPPPYPPPYGPPPGADKPPVYQGPPPPPDTRSRTSIFFGPRLGISIPAGSLPDGAGGSVKMNDASNPGPAFGVEGAFRFARIFYFGALFEGAAYGETTHQIASSSGSITSSTKTSSNSFLFGGKFGILTNPDGFAFMGDVGIGYRTFNSKVTVAGLEDSRNVNGADFLLGVGMHFKVGKLLRLVPKADLGLGSFSSERSGSVLGGSATTNFSDSQGHSFFWLGLGGYFDINLDKRAQAAATTPPGAPGSSPSPAPAAPPAGAGTGPTPSPVTAL